MSRIRILSDHLASQIAAGEVVERPASVVKELVENALDAGARSVEVELVAGGKRRIVVTDDGSGMDGNDALLAFDRHATSKIETFEDLEGVETLGFRGEALASIAAVARVELLTAEAPGEGTRVRIEGGAVRSVQPAGAAKGTRIEVASLFYNVPARRKFVKSPQTELRRALEVVQGYALARPDVRFKLSHEGRALLDLAAVGEESEAARLRISQIFGGELADCLVALPESSGVERERIWGFVGDPSTTRGRRYFVFVNRRLVRDRAVMATFYRAVREQWKYDEFPALFVFLDLPKSEVDVNVHPQKSEVRFRNPAVLRRLEMVLRRALELAHGEVEAPLEELARDVAPGAPLAWQGLGERSRYGASDAYQVAEPPAGSATRLADVAYAPMPGVTVPLSGRSGETRPFRLLGQYKGTLLLLEGPDGLYLIDQHVAHERILYERFRAELRSEQMKSQALLEPLQLGLSGAELLRLRELGPALERYGFSLIELGDDGLGLVRAPSVLSVDDAERLLLRLAADRDSGSELVEQLRDRLLDDLAASTACRAAVKMHEPLSVAEMEALVSELFAAEDPYACPHGRPIVLRMGDADLERRFGRR